MDVSGDVPAPWPRWSSSSSPAGERADLISFKLDDRSQAGITNVWLVWTIKNSSSEKSDYSWEWEAAQAQLGVLGARQRANPDSPQMDTHIQIGPTGRKLLPLTVTNGGPAPAASGHVH
ncbi:hypothetical protein [Streptomyces canus]|uniref:hypothetical protein n=1 Tax=Streptomyces canus TaxID=58343 RepID=UPI0037F74C3C